MYNSLVLVALLPFSGSDDDRRLVSLPPAPVIRYAEADRSNGIPTAIVRTTVAKPTVDSPETAGWAAPVVPQSPTAPRLAQAASRNPSKIPATPSNPENPVVPQTFAPIQPTTHPNIEPPIASTARPRDSNIVETHGMLKIPQWNHTVMSANFQAVLMELRTERRDEQGNIVRDANGQPIIDPIREGMFVFKDQILGKFDDRELEIQLGQEQKKLDVAKAAQEKQIEVVYAARQVQTAVAALNMYKEANNRYDGAITPMEIIKAELEVSQAKANLELQQYTIDVEKTAEVSVQEQSVEGMQHRIRLRKLVAPISGMVVKIDKAEGEWLREGDPVLEIVQLDTLRATCKVDARYYTPDMVDGKEVTVLMPMVNGRIEEFPGKVVFADQTIQAGEEFEVFIEVPNRRVGRSWLLQPGRTVKAKIRL